MNTIIEINTALSGWNFSQQQIDRIVEALEGHPQKKDHFRYVCSRSKK